MTGVQMCIATSFVGGLVLGLIAGIFLAVVFYYSCADNSEVSKRDHALRLLRVHNAYSNSKLYCGLAKRAEDINSIILKGRFKNKGIMWERAYRYWKRKAEVLK